MEPEEKKEAPSFIVDSRLRQWVKETGHKCSDGLTNELNRKVEAILRRAVDRAQANSRATIRPEDI